MKILLIEDNPDSRRNLRRLIEKRGHEVTACASAEEAEVELEKTSFPFLILDWMLPGKSGLELCRILRAGPDGDEMFILLVTGRTDLGDFEEAMDAGANDYLTKPFDVRRMNVRLTVAERHIAGLQERNQARRALQQSVAQTTDILEKTSDGFFSLDPNWKFTYVNARVGTMLDRERSRVLGKTLWDIFPKICGTVFEENYRLVMATRTALEFEAQSVNGLAWYEVHAYPSSDGISVFIRDISERKRAEEERLTTSKLESLGTLAGGIAHDMNNVLTVIAGNIGLAQLETPTHCGNLPFLAKAGHAAQHAARLSSQLLTFSKGGAPVKKVAALGDILTRAAEFALYGSNLRAAIEIEDHLGKAEIDVGQIEQVINGLMINAREAMPNGGVVSVCAENFTIHDQSGAPLAPGRYIKVMIADAGSGVPADLVTKIFDPYFTTKPTSSGLGLAICYSIIKKHGGFLHLENNSAAGATFSFYLPMARCRVVNDPFETNPDGSERQQQRILVMDDEAAIRDLTSQLLATMGYEVTAVPDGSEAVRIYERARRKGEAFQAVILDATIRGGVGGVETIERLRTLDPQVNAIICSGYSDAAAISSFLTYGFRGALSKPFTRRELADALDKALAGNPAN